jgi:hypothetical protein
MDRYLRILKRRALESQSPEDYERYIHALERLVGGIDPLPDPVIDPEYPNECIIRTVNGNELRCPAYPEDCHFVRVTNSEGQQIQSAYWNYMEWEEAPQEVMGAIIGALLSDDDVALED